MANKGEEGVLLFLHLFQRFRMPDHLIPDLVLRHGQFLVRNALRTKLGRLLQNNLPVKHERTTEWQDSYVPFLLRLLRRLLEFFIFLHVLLELAIPMGFSICQSLSLEHFVGQSCLFPVLALVMWIAETNLGLFQDSAVVIQSCLFGIHDLLSGFVFCGLFRHFRHDCTDLVQIELLPGLGFLSPLIRIRRRGGTSMAF